LKVYVEPYNGVGSLAIQIESKKLFRQWFS